MKRLLPVRQTLPGFTLLELLLAVVIFALVVAAMNTVFYGAMRLREKTAQSVEEALPLQQALEIMRRDLEGIVLPGTNLLQGALRSQMTTTSANQQGNGPEIYTSTGAVDENSPFGSVQKVTYYLKSPTNGVFTARGKDLFRGVTRNLLATIQETPEEQPLMNNVEQLDFSYYDGSQWRPNWDGTNEVSVLPRAIKASLLLASAGTDPRNRNPIELIVPVLVQPITNTTDTAESATTQ